MSNEQLSKYLDLINPLADIPNKYVYSYNTNVEPYTTVDLRNFVYGRIYTMMTEDEVSPYLIALLALVANTQDTEWLVQAFGYAGTHQGFEKTVKRFFNANPSLKAQHLEKKDINLTPFVTSGEVYDISDDPFVDALTDIQPAITQKMGEGFLLGARDVVENAFKKLKATNVDLVYWYCKARYAVAFKDATISYTIGYNLARLAYAKDFEELNTASTKFQQAISDLIKYNDEVDIINDKLFLANTSFLGKVDVQKFKDFYDRAYDLSIERLDFKFVTEDEGLAEIHGESNLQVQQAKKIRSRLLSKILPYASDSDRGEQLTDLIKAVNNASWFTRTIHIGDESKDSMIADMIDVFLTNVKGKKDTDEYLKPSDLIGLVIP